MYEHIILKYFLKEQSKSPFIYTEKSYLAKDTSRSEWLWPKRQGRDVTGLLRSCFRRRGLGQSDEMISKWWVLAATERRKLQLHQRSWQVMRGTHINLLLLAVLGQGGGGLGEISAVNWSESHSLVPGKLPPRDTGTNPRMVWNVYKCTHLSL